MAGERDAGWDGLDDDGPVVAAPALRAAFWLAQARDGVEAPHSEEEMRAQVDAAGDPTEIVRGAVLIVGAMGDYIAERVTLPDDVDPARLMGSGVRRMHEAGAVAPEQLPFAAGLLTAALVARVDTVAWVDEIGAKLTHMAPALGVLADLMDLIDTVHDRPGTAVEILAAIVD